MAADRPTVVGPPSRIDLTLEAPRAWAELGGFIAAGPVLRSLPRGDGHPVLVLPGFLASDSSTIALRRLLRSLGHRAYGWRLGRNLGPTGAVVDGVERSVMQLSSRHDQPIDLVGWSLGGVYARELGRRHPERVRQVISLGSPFNMTDRRGSHSSDDYDRFAPLHDRDSSFVTGFVPSPEPLPIPSTAIYTPDRRDRGVADLRPADRRSQREHRGDGAATAASATTRRWRSSSPIVSPRPRLSGGRSTRLTGCAGCTRMPSKVREPHRILRTREATDGSHEPARRVVPPHRGCRPHHPLHIGSIGIFEGPPPAGPSSPGCSRPTSRRCPAIASASSSVPFGIARPVWVDDADFNVDYHVRRTALPAPGRRATSCGRWSGG